MERGLSRGDLSSILNPGLFISPFTVDAKTASRKAQRNTSRYCIRGDGGALRGREPKTNGEKFMHSLSGPRARSREFLQPSRECRVGSRRWKDGAAGGGETHHAVAKIATACGIRNLAVTAAAYEGDCAWAKSNFPPSLMENNSRRSNAKGTQAWKRAREFA